MKSGTSKMSLAEEVVENNKPLEGVTRQEKNEFMEMVAEAISDGPKDGNPMPEIEAERRVIEHFNKAGMKDFDSSLYFIYHNVKVFEKGRKDEAKKLERMSVEERNFGKLR